jgi:aerobic-type carbon monoxide dehydrogenase small subunit (CoxS/CutS family)
MREEIQLTVNGARQRRLVEPRLLLADFLRDDLGLTGTKLGCEHGVCGACTVLLDGAAVRSCLLFGVQANGADILTVEGLAEGAELHPLQQAFTDNHSLQCGFCTSGFLLSAYSLLQDSPKPSAEEIRRALAGNLCRCTGYQGIVEAVEQAARTMRKRRP